MGSIRALQSLRSPRGANRWKPVALTSSRSHTVPSVIKPMLGNARCRLQFTSPTPARPPGADQSAAHQPLPEAAPTATGTTFTITAVSRSLAVGILLGTSFVLAYSFDGKTVLRGGVGSFHNRLVINGNTLLGGNAPLQLMQVVTNARSLSEATRRKTLRGMCDGPRWMTQRPASSLPSVLGMPLPSTAATRIAPEEFGGRCGRAGLSRNVKVLSAKIQAREAGDGDGQVGAASCSPAEN